MREYIRVSAADKVGLVEDEKLYTVTQPNDKSSASRYRILV